MKNLEKDVQLSLKYKLADRDIQRELLKIEDENKEVIRQTTEACLLFLNNKFYYKMLTNKKEYIKKQNIIMRYLEKSFPLMDKKTVRKMLIKSFYLDKESYDLIFFPIISVIFCLFGFWYVLTPEFFIIVIVIILGGLFSVLYDFIKNFKS